MYAYVLLFRTLRLVSVLFGATFLFLCIHTNCYVDASSVLARERRICMYAYVFFRLYGCPVYSAPEYVISFLVQRFREYNILGVEVTVRIPT